MTAGSRAKVYPNDIFGHEGTGEIVLLIPNSTGCSNFFVDVGEWAMPLEPLTQPRARRFIRKRKALDPEATRAKRPKMVINGFKKNKNANKERNSSLKQHTFNHI